MVMLNKKKSKQPLKSSIERWLWKEVFITPPKLEFFNFEYSYKEADHICAFEKGQDTLNYSIIIEARSLEEAKQLYREQLKYEHYYEEYNSS